MIIRMNTTAAGPDGVFVAGVEYDMDEKKAKQLIKGNYAVAVEDGVVDVDNNRKV